jgi:hypothetical protein
MNIPRLETTRRAPHCASFGRPTSRVRWLGLLIPFLGTAVIASSAYAVPNWKKPGGPFLKLGQVVRVNTKGTNIWTGPGLTLRCKAKGKEELIGIGENQYNSFTFETCEVLNPEVGCTATMASLNVGAPKWHTTLLDLVEEFFVRLSQLEFELTLKGATCPLPLTRRERVTVTYSWVAEGGSYIPADQKLEEGEEITLEGTEELEPEEGGKVEVGNESEKESKEREELEKEEKAKKC